MLKKTAFLAVLAAATLAGCAPNARTAEPARAPAIAAEPPAVAAKPPSLAAAPDIRAEELVDVSAVTSNRFATAEKPGEILVRLHLTARARKDTRRPPINLALVVDTSGSMEGAAIENARSASLALLDSLSEGDRLALIVFHSTTEVLVPSTQLDRKTIAEIRGKIATIKATGTTDLAGGLSAGLAEVQKSFKADGINRVVLLGDGVANDPTPLPNLAYTAGQHRIAISALGLGLDYDETQMSKLALASGGKYHFINDSSKVAKVFSDEVLRLKEVSGRAAVLALKPGPGVAVKEVIGLPLQHTAHGAQLVLGDMSEGDERDLMVRLAVPARHSGSLVELLDAELAFDHPSKPGIRLSERAFVSAKATADAADLEKGRDKEVEHAAVRLAVADAIVRAVATARTGDLKLARSILDQAEKDARAAAKLFNDSELAEKAKTIPPLRKSLASLAPPPPPSGPDIAPVRPGIPQATPAASVSMDAPAPVKAMVMQAQAEAVRTIQGE